MILIRKFFTINQLLANGIDRSRDHSRSVSSDVSGVSRKFMCVDTLYASASVSTQNRDINYVHTCVKSNLMPPYAAYMGCPSVKWERNICIANPTCVALHYVFVDPEYNI